MCFLYVRCKGLQRECSVTSSSALQRVLSTPALHLDSAQCPLDLFGAPVEQCPEVLLHRLAMPSRPQLPQPQHPALLLERSHTFGSCVRGPLWASPAIDLAVTISTSYVSTRSWCADTEGCCKGHS